MDDFRQIVRSLQGPLEVEARNGYPDTAVIGASIAGYARAWAERAGAAADRDGLRARCAQIRDLLADYARSDPEGRRSRADGALKLLAELPAASQPEPAAKAPRGRVKRASRRPPAADATLRSTPLRRADSPPGIRGCSTSEKPLLDQPLMGGGKSHLPWVRRLAKLGIQTNRDLLYHFPRDYVPLRRISELTDGERAAIIVEAVAREEAVVRGGRSFRLLRYALEVADSTGRAWVVSFARLPHRGGRARAIESSPLSLSFAAGTRLLVEGLVQRAGRFIEIQFSGAERLDGSVRFESGALLPVYPLTEGVYQGQVRPAVRWLLDRLPGDLPDPLPASLRGRHDLVPLAQALREVHAPSSLEAKEASARRLAFEELLILQVALAQRKQQRRQPGTGISMPPRGDSVALLEEILPFSLTRAQQRVISEVAADMASDLPMCRLIQGDVGSGKTMVAAAALLIALQNGYQGALMAPTELLAEQHYLVLSRLLAPVGVAVELLTGSQRERKREEANRRIASGRAQVIVGTHALIQEGVEFQRLGLVVIDEQHRFGVRQRAELRTKGQQADSLPLLRHPSAEATAHQGRPPDIVVMTATPIPRTFALTVYGDLDTSILDELPPGRRPITTTWFPLTRERETYEFVRAQVEAGRQAYVVCPLIEESERLQATAATELAVRLQQEIFPDLRVGLLHGEMRVAEKEAVMEAFRRGEVDVLTTTTVIEVGVDVPNATVMLILNAERFGLAQLHQLRGRVGRGAQASHCLLLSHQKYDPSGRLAPRGDDSLDTARQRLRVLLEESDGFKIAEQDLLLRGPGELYGTRQHGLPDFRMASLAGDLRVLEEAREAAFSLIARDPALAEAEHAALREQVVELRARMDSAPG